MVEVIERDDPAGLYVKYQNQAFPEKVYIYLDLQGKLMYADTGIYGGAVSVPVHHGLIRRYEIPTLTAEAVNEKMHEIAPLADRILTDWEDEWYDGSLRGVLGSFAQEAEREIERVLGSVSPDSTYPWHDLYDPMDIVGEADYEYTVEDLAKWGVTSNSTDKEIEELTYRLVKEIQEDSTDRVVAVIGLYQHLRDLQDEMRDDEES